MRPLLSPRSLLVDIGLVVWMAGIALFMSSRWEDPHDLWRELDTLGIALLLLAHLPLVARRWAPVPVLLAVSAAAGTYLTLGYYHSVTTFAFALALFSVAAYRPRHISLRCMALVIVLLIWGNRLAEPGLRISGATIAVMIGLIAWAFGDGTRQLTERGSRLAVLTDQLRREQEERARQAVAREQSRIARELHDVVAHHMSVISVQAGLGRYVFEADPAMARNALGVIGATAHEALGEMRRLLAVLRVSAEEPDPQEAPYDAAPGLARLDELIERVRTAGATIEFEITGDPVVLAPGLDLCVYRVIQESLTNVLKHADPPIATVALHWRPDELTVRITDRGEPAKVPQESGVTGHGLIGMRERARIYGGTLEAASLPQGGFGVTLTLPTGERDS